RGCRHCHRRRGCGQKTDPWRQRGSTFRPASNGVAPATMPILRLRREPAAEPRMDGAGGARYVAAREIEARYGEAENGPRRVLALARRGVGLDQRDREVDHRTRFMGKGGGAEAAYLDKAGNGLGRFGDEAAAAGREP